MRLVVAACLLGSLGLWGWALYAPKHAPSLPEQHVGTFEIYRYEPPTLGPKTNAYPPGQRWTYTFHGDSTYTITIEVANEYEMKRFQGTAVLDGDWIVLTQVSDDRKLSPGEPWRARWETGEDKEGTFVRLVEENGAQHFMRRVADPEG